MHIADNVNRRRYRVFISHSANIEEEPETQEFLDSLSDRLIKDCQTEVLTDQRSLKAGDDWCQRLYAWIGLCDAAVILLSPRAVTRKNSTWVPREVNLLLWRKSLDPNFTVIPVLLAGLQRADIADSPFIADTNLIELQFADASTQKEKLNKICKEVRKRSEVAATRTAFNAIQVFVEDSIQRYAPPMSVNDTIANHYQADTWLPYQSSQGLLAVKMVKDAVAPDVDSVIMDVSRGSQPDFSLGARLLTALFPLRLPAESACNLLSLCKEQTGQGGLVVNCHDTWAVRMLLKAATGKLDDDLNRSWRILELPDGWGDDDEEEISLFLAAELAEAVLGTGGWDILCEEADPIAALRLHLSEYSRDSGAPILVCASYSPRWMQLAPKLAFKFRSIVILLWSGRSVPARTDQAGGGMVTLEPSLPDGADRSWNMNFRRKMQLLGSP